MMCAFAASTEGPSLVWADPNVSNKRGAKALPEDFVYSHLTNESVSIASLKASKTVER